MDTYDAIDKLADEYLARRYTGSVESRYSTMKCVDFFNSRELDAAVRRGGG